MTINNLPRWKRAARPIVSLCAIGACLTANATAFAGVLTFDDLPTPPTLPTGAQTAPVPNGYGGLNWSNFDYTNDDANAPNGYQAGTVSGRYVGFNGFSNPASFSVSSDTPFSLLSGYFTAAWNDNLTVVVTAYRNSAPVASTWFILNATAPTLENLNFVDVDSVTFTSSGGTHHAGYSSGSGTHFAVDNLTIGLVPEPASWVAICGVGVGIAVRRRRAA